MLFDPFLWVHTFEHLGETSSYHMRFKVSKHVQSANYPFWQPLNWLFNPFCTYNPVYDPRANDSFLFSLDTLIFFLALIGLPRTCKRQSVFLIRLVVMMITLFLWE